MSSRCVGTRRQRGRDRTSFARYRSDRFDGQCRGNPLVHSVRQRHLSKCIGDRNIERTATAMSFGLGRIVDQQLQRRRRKARRNVVAPRTATVEGVQERQIGSGFVRNGGVRRRSAVAGRFFLPVGPIIHTAGLFSLGPRRLRRRVLLLEIGEVITTCVGIGSVALRSSGLKSDRFGSFRFLRCGVDGRRRFVELVLYRR